MSNQHANVTTSSQTLSTTTEKVVATLSPAIVTNQPGGEGVCVTGTVNLTSGTATTAFVMRCYRGTSASGTQIGNSLTDTIAAAASRTVTAMFLDTSASALGSGTTGIQYCITIQQTAATADGTVNYACITAESATASE